MNARRPAALPPLYAILDVETLARQELETVATARHLVAAGVLLIQYRDKRASLTEYRAMALRLREAVPRVTLILNDHADLVRNTGANGVHLGQSDALPREARQALPSEALIGRSTHTLAEALAAEQDDTVDYVAFGPIFATRSKHNPEPAVGLAALHEAAQRVQKPLVAIGGITAASVAAVLAAGATSVALISELYPPGNFSEEHVRSLVRLTRTC